MEKLGKFHRQRRIILAILIVFMILGLLFARSNWDEDIHEFIEAIGIGLIGIAIIGRIWSILYIGGQKGTSIVRSGPYSITRNPLYLFSSIGAGGVGAQTGSVLAAILFAVSCVLVFGYVIIREERHLFDRFGSVFSEYVEQVPRLFPNFALFQDSETLTVKTKAVYSTFFEGLIFFVAKPGFEIVEFLQDANYIHPLFSIP